MVKEITLGSLVAWIHPTEKPPKARLLLIHGINEHSGRHLNTVEWLVKHQIEVVRFDLRGSGRSGGRKQWVEFFEDYVDDTARVFNWISSNLEKLPFFVLGHSLGGTIATHFAAAYGRELDGLILSGPAHLVGDGIPGWKIVAGRILRKIAPTLRVAGSPDHSALSRDPAVGEAFAKDPLSYHFNTAQQGDEILRALGRMLKLCRQIRVPVLIVHGAMDRIIRVEGSYQMLAAMLSDDKTIYLVPGGYHEPHNDIGKEEYFELLTKWILTHLRPSSGSGGNAG